MSSPRLRQDMLEVTEYINGLLGSEDDETFEDIDFGIESIENQTDDEDIIISGVEIEDLAEDDEDIIISGVEIEDLAEDDEDIIISGVEIEDLAEDTENIAENEERHINEDDVSLTSEDVDLELNDPFPNATGGAEVDNGESQNKTKNSKLLKLVKNWKSMNHDLDVTAMQPTPKPTMTLREIQDFLLQEMPKPPSESSYMYLEVVMQQLFYIFNSKEQKKDSTPAPKPNENNK